MSGALPHHPSSPQDQQRHATANGGGDQKDAYVDSHIVELSVMIDREIRSNTWESSSSQAKTIFHVPNKHKLQAAADKSTYQPSFLSIGPYHVNATEEMRRNEQHKLWLLDYFIPQGGERPVLEYTQAVESMEDKARSCYEGEVEMDRDAFCRMLLLDAFQLIVLLEMLEPAEKDDDDGAQAEAGAAAAAAEAEAASPSSSQGQVGCNSMTTRDIILTINDMMMLENQIPFFVVEKIYELHYGGHGNGNGNAATATMRPARRLAWEATTAILGGIPSSVPNDDRQLLVIQHLVHVCHVYLKPTCLNINKGSKKFRNKKQTDRYARFRRATEYYEAGVSIRRWCWQEGSQPGRRRPMLDVAFNNGILSVALQDIDENTVYILRNVLAYEQMYNQTATNPGTSYVTAYVVFMSQLLRSAEDVALLARRGVLQHLLGDDADVCALFRGLADGLAFNPSSNHYLCPVEEALQAHCRHRRYRWRAWIVRHRFSNPWLVAAWLFGGSAVLCTIIQTVFTVLSYVQQPH